MGRVRVWFGVGVGVRGGLGVRVREKGLGLGLGLGLGYAWPRRGAPTNPYPDPRLLPLTPSLAPSPVRTGLVGEDPRIERELDCVLVRVRDLVSVLVRVRG